jgi:replicative DNA helicase
MENQVKMPSSFEAESYIIGCLLLFEDVADEVFGRIVSKDFYYEQNRTIMEAIEAIYNRKGIIDQVVVLDELKKNNKLEAAGGIENFYSIIGSIPSSANVEAYTQLIYEKSAERTLFNAVDRIRTDILNGTYAHEDLMIRSENTFTNALKNESNEDFKRIDLLTDNIISIIEENKNRDGNLVGLDTGYPALNNFTSGFKKGELIILAARPSIGKSTFALNLATNVCRNKKSVALFSLEMGDDQLIMRLLSTYSGVNLNKIVSGNLSDEEMSLIMQARNTLNRLHLYLDQSSTTNLRDIKLKCQKLHREGHLDFIVIDYLQLLSSGENRMNRVEEVSKISRGLKEMARTFGVPILALSQLSRDLEKREDKRPVLADLRESGSIEQDADIVMFLHRDIPKKDDGNPDTTRVVHSAKTEVIIAKNRQGMTGSFNLIFKGANSVFNAVED